MAMVDFCGIGVQKGGTTWLYENLAAHPDVWFPFIKEVHFFDRARASLDRARKSGEFEELQIVTKIRGRIKKLRSGAIKSRFGRKKELAYLRRLVERDFLLTDAWYDFLFSPAPAGSKTGEITPFYCAMGEPGIIEMKKRCGSATLIYLVRDPVDRGLSCLRMAGKRWAVDMTDARAVAQLAETCLENKFFRSRGDFRGNIPLWDRHFGDRVLYLPFGQIRSDPERVLRQVESAIGVRPFDAYPSVHEPVHVTSKPAPIPDAVRRRFAEANADQYEFLKRRFPPEFVEQLR
jgi:hypothetical protein